MRERSYHHGALRPVLLEVAEQMLERDGPDLLSLRAIARAAGVSHAAPAHHFGDLRGLLTALAAMGFRRFTEQLEAAAATQEDRLRALGRAYVGFAREHSGLFLLMFRHGQLDRQDAALKTAAAASFAVLAKAAGRHAHPLASWCLVHGFAMLLLDHRLPPAPAPEVLLESVLGAD